MNGIPEQDVRNLAVVGHTGSGKTTLIEALLHAMGVQKTRGSVDNGTSAGDYTDEEKARKITIFAKPFTGERVSGGKKSAIVVTDTPGYADFFGQVVAALRAAETALIVVDAGSGVQVGTRRFSRAAKKAGLARTVAITGLDRENTSYEKTLAQIQGTLGENCIPVTLPSADGASVANVLNAKDRENNPAAEEAYGKLVELAAETDDSLIEKYLGGESLSSEELSNGLRMAVSNGGLVPVFACLPLKEVGITEFLDGIVAMCPSPVDRPATDVEGNEIGTAKDAPLVGLAWRVITDPFVGQLTFVRVLGGTLRSDSEILNVSKGQKERIGSLLVVNGKDQHAVSEATAGDVVAIPKLKETGVGDTLNDSGTKIVCPPIPFPTPVMFQAVRAKTRGDEDKIGTALSRVCEEDPTLRVERNRATKETVLKGLGDVHIEVATELMKRRSNVEVLLSTPKVPYRETVTATGEGHYKHKKQSGGRGQYGEVYLRVEPKDPAEEEWFVDAIVGGAIPGNFLPAVQKGLVEGMASGAVAGYPVTNVKVTVYDGSYHEVDSSEIAFKIAGARAFREAMSQAKPVLLEPIMKVKVMIPEQCMGDVNGDLNQRRGRILGMGSEEGMQVITADVPQAEMFRYTAELRSMTAGQGTFEMEFSRYEIVPANVTQKVVAAAQAEKEKDE